MKTPPETVDWPSILFALLVDSLLVWVPGVLLLLSPARLGWASLALGIAALASNCFLYARGATLGSLLGGLAALLGLGLNRPPPPHSADRPGPLKGTGPASCVGALEA
ncbi:hypothetical protein [Sinomonas halotolerans]|uniref:Uncharacterized protein n=1 Tax=Sinomonas halotolerans TaxID=1644133 RepID=A0ABU9WZY0_9MICC